MARRDNRPSLQWYPKDWKSDSDLDKCSVSTRGCWWEWLQSMWLDDTFEVTGTFVELARVAKCTSEQAQKAVKELGRHKAAEVTALPCVTKRGQIVTIMSRRLKREWDERKSNADKQKRYREGKRDEDVTPVLPESNPPSSSSASSPSSVPTSQQLPLVGSDEPDPNDDGYKELFVRLAKPKKPTKKTTDPNHKPFIEWFCAEYAEEMGGKYVFRDAQDGKTVKNLLKLCNFDELKQCAKQMFDDDWAREKGADLGQLLSQINKWKNAASPKLTGLDAAIAEAKRMGIYEE